MLIAFHNTTVTKPEILAQLRAHAAADEIVKGQYWQNGKGCAVGCTIHSDDHAEYELRFGIPQMLARLKDCIFEGLSNHKSKTWPIRFMSAVEEGSDQNLTGWKFLYWLLTDEKVNPGINHPLVRNAVMQCAEILVPLTQGESTAESAESAASAAWSAASAAESAESAARSAASAAESAESAASAAWSAASAARNAASTAARAARSAASAARSAASTARSAAWVRMADKLVELIKDAPKAKTLEPT